ncbi:putative DNA replication factor Cdt1 [Planoprotostelium fungivorum]|uniref:Putative DNA replication factor Cdt1 n=1 Tax=Planoprotostelium fungivorum TaxID=1890364 RepID=A0A2P6NFH2_9EUKA|nr:putative DNA replication factor Cdt1 [Planoprotostelium fungivorum]
MPPKNTKSTAKSKSDAPATRKTSIKRKAAAIETSTNDESLQPKYRPSARAMKMAQMAEDMDKRDSIKNDSKSEAKEDKMILASPTSNPSNLTPKSPSILKKSTASPVKKVKFASEPRPSQVVSSPLTPDSTQQQKLPLKLKEILDHFEDLEVALTYLEGRKTICTFDKLNRAFNSMSHRDLSLRTLGQIRTVYPDGYDFAILRKDLVIMRRLTDRELELHPESKEEHFTMIKSQSELRARRIQFRKNLRTIALRKSGDQDIEPSEIPTPPTELPTPKPKPVQMKNLPTQQTTEKEVELTKEEMEEIRSRPIDGELEGLDPELVFKVGVPRDQGMTSDQIRRKALLKKQAKERGE